MTFTPAGEVLAAELATYAILTAIAAALWAWAVYRLAVPPHRHRRPKEETR